MLVGADALVHFLEVVARGFTLSLTLAAFLAGLNRNGGAKSVVLLLWDDDVVTGIESTEKVDYEPARDGHVYSISGQRLSAPRKGINIINGRKVIVK